MRTVVVLSGGMDSTTLLYDLAQTRDVFPITVDYGQRHEKEIQFAAQAARSLGLVHNLVNLRTLQGTLGASALTDPDREIPEGHYEAESMKDTVVPNRNMILLSVAIAYAITIGATEVAYAAHAGDHAIYPDCRKEFVDIMAAAALVCSWEPITLKAPFVTLSKAGIVKIGAKLNVPYDKTWSCYKGGSVHCGKCGTCVERREAFQLAEVTDPTEYAP